MEGVIKLTLVYIYSKFMILIIDEKEAFRPLYISRAEYTHQKSLQLQSHFHEFMRKVSQYK